MQGIKYCHATWICMLWHVTRMYLMYLIFVLSYVSCYKRITYGGSIHFPNSVVIWYQFSPLLTILCWYFDWQFHHIIVWVNYIVCRWFPKLSWCIIIYLWYNEVIFTHACMHHQPTNSSTFHAFIIFSLSPFTLYGLVSNKTTYCLAISSQILIEHN